MAKRKVSDILCRVEGCDLPMVCRGYCNPHYQRWYHHGDPLRGSRPVGALPTIRCTVDGCKAPPRTTFSKYCEVHNARLRRNGHFDRVMEAHRLEHTGGYVLIPARGHPMAVGYIHAYEHRVVFYDAYGAGPFACHVCGKEAMLADLDVDHLNEVKDDNRLENLGPACPKCNRERSRPTRQETWSKQNVRLIEFNGERLPLAEWARRLGVRANSIVLRLKNGWPIERALTEPRGAAGPRSRRGDATRSHGAPQP